MSSSMISWANTTLGLAVPALTVLIGATVALVAYHQWKTNREKLRFDLYQHRFEIYLRVLEFHLALMEWQDEPKLAVLHRPFLKAFCESKFLFPKESRVYDFLEEYNMRAARVRVFKSQIPPRGDASPREREQLTEDEIWIKDCIGTLEEKLGPYLNFHDI